MQRDTINQNHPGDWDEQRERLSAYLDGEIDEGEQAALERHLPACEQCQRTLDEFREIRVLLRAMPMPASPRSFAIPMTGEVPVPLAAAATNRLERDARRVRGAGPWSGALQALGSFVAAAGVILVLGSALTGVGPRYGSASSASHASGAAQAPQTTQHDSTSTAFGARQTTPTNATQDTPTPMPTAVPAGGNSEFGAEQPANLPVAPIGAGMVAGGAVLVVVGRVAGRKRRQA